MAETTTLATTPDERAVMRALMERGHYEETPEDFAWANADAVTVMRWLDERGRTLRVLSDALFDTGIHEDVEDEYACLTADCLAIAKALGSGLDIAPLEPDDNGSSDLAGGEEL